MRYNVLMTETAISDFKKIARDILDISKNIDTAVKFVTEMKAECNRLADFPQSGALPNDRNLVCQGYRFLVHKEYLIFYTYEDGDDTVYVKAAFNAKLDYKRVMRTIK